MADPYTGAARALLGQGVGMGWGDEAEAWLRSKLGPEKYEDALPRIRQEYAQYAKDNPFTTGTLEFAGGALPGVAAMMIPGGQAAGAAQLARSSASTLARMAGLGALSGGVAGAGGANEGERGLGAATGALLGGSLGAAIPVGLRGASGGGKWLRERFAPTESVIADRATGKLSGALKEAGMTPSDITSQMAKDATMGIPSTVANSNNAMVDLAKAVAQRTGSGTRKVEDTLIEQSLGNRDRTYGQIAKNLKPGKYYEDLDALQLDLKTKAAPLYKTAYEHGEVTDPEVLKFLQLPQFKEGLGKARKLLAAEGRDLPMTVSTDPITGQQVSRLAPTVEVLDQVKRGLDSLIEGQTDAVTGKVTSLGRVYVGKKNEFLSALDKAVPAYGQARSVYKGDAELTDAMRKGMNEFNSLDHEQVIKMVGGMSAAEKEAFKTGAARNLYGTIMKPSGNFNASQRIINSPETAAKLRPLFDNQAQYDFFEAALKREAQLFQQSNRILGGSSTAKNLFAGKALDEQPGVAGAVIDSFDIGFARSLSNSAMGFLRQGQMSEKMTDKLSGMLMSNNPAEVAAVVKLLEDYSEKAAPAALKAGIAEAGAVTGTMGAIQPPPAVNNQGSGIEKDLGPVVAEPRPQGADIEADLAADLKAAEPQQYQPPPRIDQPVEDFGGPATLR